ncbi:hypothetical protein EBB07_18940 [Paenibacillaceae bacterium]|nr:hypothetical protein EBB07_18940 [Paenibacillaceae bacterium]
MEKDSRGAQRTSRAREAPEMEKDSRGAQRTSKAREAPEMEKDSRGAQRTSKAREAPRWRRTREAHRERVRNAKRRNGEGLARRTENQ